MAIAAPTCPPLGLAYLAAALRQAGHEVSVIDAVGEAPDRYSPIDGRSSLLHGLPVCEVVDGIPSTVDVVGVSCMFSHEWPSNRALIEAIRREFPEATIVVGGEHPSALAEFVLADCAAVDVVVVGEGEATLAEVVRVHADSAKLASIPGVRIRGGTLSVDPAGGSPRITEIDEIPRPAWDLLPLRNYLDRGLGFGVHRGRSMPMLATRGCPYQCTFCSSPAMWTTRWTPRSPQAVVDEIAEWIREYDIENVDFYDLTAVIRKSWIVEFCELLLERDIRVTWQLPSGTRSEAIDDDVVRLMHRAGCRNISYAPESGSDGLLERVKKRVDLDRMKRSMRAAVQAGVNAKANLMIGLPGETHADVRQTIAFAVATAWSGLHDVSVALFSPYPGTALFDRLREDGAIPRLDDDYFWSLLAYSDLTDARSWSVHLSDRAVARYRWLILCSFYGVSFLRRPWRVARLVRNACFSETQESRLELSLRQLVAHRRAALRHPTVVSP